MSQFHLFKNEFTIQGELHLETAMHIGAGNTGLFGVDDEVVKNQAGFPYIPGSSLKGTTRSLLERIANHLPIEGDAKPCISTGENQLCLAKDDLSTKKGREGKSPEQVAALVAARSCPICHLFGNMMMSGKVQFFDCEVHRDSWIGQFDYRDGVAINRETLTAKDGAKYEFEAVPAGTVFHLSVRAVNLSDLEKKWLFVALEMIRQGEVLIGGKVARGLGKVRGENWTISERTPDNFFKTLLKKEESRKPFEQYVTPLLTSLVGEA